MKPSEGRIPNLQLQSPAVDFIENSLDKYHPAFSTPPSRYDPHFGGFVIQDSQNLTPARVATSMAVTMHDSVYFPMPDSALTTTTRPSQTPESSQRIAPRPTTQVVDALEFWDSLFPKAMTYLVQSRPDEPKHLIQSRSRIRDKKSWTEVFDQVEAAKNEYRNVDNKFKAGVRKVYRKFGEQVAEPLNRMTKLVPGGGDMGTVAVTPIIGCVQILLEAAQAASNVRKTMVDSFGDVDKMFAEVELFLQIYPGDENIKKASIELIANTLLAAENVIGFFLKGTGKRAFTATVHREKYEKGTIESLNNIKLQCEQLLHEAEKTHMYQTSHANNHLMNTTASIQEEVHSMRNEQVRRHDLRDFMLVLCDELDRRTTILHQRQEEEIALQIISLHAAATDAMLHTSTPAPLAWQQTATLEGQNVQHLMTASEILSCIRIPDILSEDYRNLAEKRKVLVPAPEQARAEQLIRTSQIREWLTSPTSSQLLVHGNYDRRAYISGLSLFCMSLAQTLTERVPRFIPLVFFCGLHTESLPDTHTGGRTLIQSLIRQLLCQYDFNGDNIPLVPEEVEYIQQGDINALCTLFERLVHMLPKGVALFCLVDGVVYYEREEFRDDFGRVLMMILRLSDQGGVQAPIKVLLTSPTRTAIVRQPFTGRDDLILSMEGMVRADLVASSSRLGRELSSGIE